MDRDTHSARVVLMIGSAKRAECLEQASAEVATSMPLSSTGGAQVAPLKRKPEAHISTVTSTPLIDCPDYNISARDNYDV